MNQALHYLIDAETRMPSGVLVRELHIDVTDGKAALGWLIEAWFGNYGTITVKHEWRKELSE